MSFLVFQFKWKKRLERCIIRLAYGLEMQKETFVYMFRAGEHIMDHYVPSHSLIAKNKVFGAALANSFSSHKIP